MKYCTNFYSDCSNHIDEIPQELVKNTPENHPDFENVLGAHKAMTEVAVLINERKRRMESIGKISLWQDSVENWRVRNI